MQVTNIPKRRRLSSRHQQLLFGFRSCGLRCWKHNAERDEGAPLALSADSRWRMSTIADVFSSPEESLAPAEVEMVWLLRFIDAAPFKWCVLIEKLVTYLE